MNVHYEHQLKFTNEGLYGEPSKGDPSASHAFLNTLSIFYKQKFVY